MFDKNYLNSLSHGDDRLDYYKKCIAEADAEKDYHSMIWLRHDYIEESVFHDDSFKAIIMFPEFMKLFDEHPGEMKPSSFMFPFKWILEAGDEYYQMSLEQIESYFERFKEYIEKFGYTMRTYYYKKFQIYQYIDKDIALKAFDEMDKYERTEISDCKACEGNGKARKEMRFGSEKKAVEMLNDMLDKNMTCAEVPQVTYGAFAYEFAKRGMYEEAVHYAELMLPMIKGDETNYATHVSHIIELKTITDPNGAFELFCRCAGKFSRIKNPSYRFSFACAAYRFFARLVEAGNTELNMRLSSDFEFFNEDGTYDCADLRDKYYAVAKDLAEKFDKRNGTDYFSSDLAFVYPEAPVKTLELPVHGSFTPESPVVGLLVHGPEDVPLAEPEEFERLLAEKCGITDVGYGHDEETNKFYVGGKTEDGSAVRYALYLHEAIDPETMKQMHWAPEGELDSLGEYEGMVVIYPTIPDADRFAELKRLLKLAAAIDKGDSPVIYDLTNSRILSKRWLALEAAGDTDPFRNYYSRVWLYRSAFAEDCGDITTTGMETFGSREFLVPAVKQDDIDFALEVLNNITNAASISPLPDEGVTRNAGIVYDEKSFVRFTWRPITIPSDGESEEEQTVYAEPIVYLTAADQAAGKGYSIGEIPEEERGKLDYRTHSRFTLTEEAKCRERFPQVLDYFLTHDCDVIVGSYFTPEEDSDEECFFHGRLTKADGEVKICVESMSDNIADIIHEGDLADIVPENVFFLRIDLDGGEDRYYVDEFYILLG